VYDRETKSDVLRSRQRVAPQVRASSIRVIRSDSVNGEVSNPRVTGIRPIFVAALAAAVLPACTQSCDALSSGEQFPIATDLFAAGYNAGRGRVNRLDHQVRRPSRPQNRPDRLGRANSVFRDTQLRTTCARKPSGLSRALGGLETRHRSGSTPRSEVQLEGSQRPRAGVYRKVPRLHRHQVGRIHLEYTKHAPAAPARRRAAG
jgi:hypothetical protein